MKKFFALVLALVMALSLATVAWGANPTTLPAGTVVDGVNVITLTSDVDLAAAVTITSDTTITAAAPGYTIDVSAVDDAFVVTDGTLTLGANVTIKSTSTSVNGGVLWANGGDIIIDGATVTSSAPCNMILVSSADSTVTVKSGTVESTSVKHSAIVINTGNYTSEPAGGIVNIEGGTVSTDAADVVSAVWGFYGTINVSGGSVINTNPNNTANSLSASGADVYITGGHVEDVGDTNGGEVFITGGTFENEPDAAYLNGLTTVKDTNGNYVVTAPVTMGDKYDLYLANAGMNAALTLKTPSVAGLSFDEVGAKTNKDGSGRVAYIAANNGQFFVKTTNPTISDYAVTDAGKNTVLYYVTVAGTSAANFEYSEAVSAFTKFSTYAKCDYVTATPVAGEDYFMAADGNVYMAAAAGTGTNYLLNGKVVSGIYAGVPETHTFTLNGYKYDATLKQNVPVSALCTKCMMNTGSIYPIAKVPATYTLYPTTGEGSNFYTVALPGASAVVTPSTPAGDKVQSAETFDAGIAMYVGMSVLAATGSAVVIGKKKD